MQSDIPNEYNNLRTQFNNLETHIRQEVWQYYLNIKKRDILNKIDALSAI